MTATGSKRMIDDMRGVRYGEVVPMFLRDTGLEAEVYGTQMLNDCPQELWQTLDANAIAKELGAVFVKLNGPMAPVSIIWARPSVCDSAQKWAAVSCMKASNSGWPCP